jgi:signal transduction histidine kinase
MGALPHCVRKAMQAFAVAALCLAPAWQAVAAGSANVLYINSYHRGYKWSDDVEAALTERLAASGTRVEVSVEYLDSRRFGFDGRGERVAAALAEKIAAYPLDVVVVSDNAAFDFATRYRPRLFPKVPIVFCGYNNFRPGVLAGLSNITGINEEVDYSGSVELALATHPATTTLAFITSTADASSAQNTKVLVDEALPRYRDRYGVVEIRDASLQQIRDRLAQLPATTVVFLAGQTSDMGEGRAYTPVENARLIAPLSPFPIYTFWDFHLGNGVLGGRVLTGADQGRAAADMALGILAGKRADDIPVTMDSPTSDIFDWPVLQRFHIAPAQLPPGSVILNRTFSLWELYRVQIGGALLVIALEALLIAALVRAMRQRRLAMVALKAERDMLDARVVERTAEIARSNAELQQFAYVASHDMREPLRMISSYLSLLERRLGQGLDQDGHDFLAFAKDGAQRLDRMILGLLDYSRIGRGGEEKEAVALSDALAEAVANLAVPIRDNQARVEVAGDLPVVWGCRAELVRLLQNLVANAVKYRAADRPPVVTVSARRDGAEWVVSVADNGVGIPDDQTERIFGIFQRLHGAEIEGCGIGLAACRKIADHHGGRIWAESEVGTGSTLRFTLPVRG